MTVTLMWIGGTTWLVLFLIQMARLNRAAIIALLVIAAIFAGLFCWGLHRLHREENSWQPSTCPNYQCEIPLLGPK